MNKQEILIITAFLGFAGLMFAATPEAMAHEFCQNYEIITPTSTTTTTGSCAVSQPMALSRIEQTYPAMNATLEVDFWQGIYQLQVNTLNTYQVNLYNCRGKLLVSTSRGWSFQELRTYSIDNPNLHGDVSTSFLANAPLTDSEALAAMKDAQSRCLADEQ